MNLRDVAKAAGVSPMTVSNVLNGRDSVRPENRERVLAAVAELGYTPNVSARQLRRGRSLVLGAVVPEAVNPFYGDVVRGIEEFALQQGTPTLTMTSHDSLANEERILELLSGLRVMGVVLSSVSNWEAILPTLESMPAQEIAVVALANAADVGSVCSTVAGDDALGGELAGRHLAELGDRRLAFLGGGRGSVFNARHSGMLRGLEEAGRPAGVAYVECGEPSLEAGYRTAMTALQSRERPEAVFCANDLLALGTLRAAASLGLSVPDDLVIIGYDDIPFAAGATVPLTSVRQPTREMGRRAAELVLRSARGELDEIVHEVFAPTLEIRDSSVGGARR